MAIPAAERKCKNCAMLCRIHIDTQEAFSAPKELREKWNEHQRFESSPVCFAQQTNFANPPPEILSLHPDNEGHRRTTTMFNLSRADCPEWREWIPGLTPKEVLELEHQERQRQADQDFLKQQAKWHRKWEEEDREWRRTQAEDQGAREDARDAVATTRFWWTFVASVVAALVGAAATVLVGNPSYWFPGGPELPVAPAATPRTKGEPPPEKGPMATPSPKPPAERK